MKIKSILLFLILITIASCSRELVNRKLFLAMGNIPVEIKVYFTQTVDFERVFAEVEDTVMYLDSVFSKYDSLSPVYRFNNKSEHIRLDSYQKELIEHSIEMSKLTDGLFDIRIETLLEYYRRCEKNQTDLSDDSVRVLSELLKRDSLFIRNDTLFKNDPRLMIDFGGIAKGYFGDVIKRILKREGVRKAVINLGGDIVLFNELDGKEFKVGIRSAESESIYKTVNLANGSIVTSGDYFRFYSINGKKYCHIVNPKTGAASDNAKSVTVVADEGYIADAAATAAMLMDENEISQFKMRNRGLEIYIQ